MLDQLRWPCGYVVQMLHKCLVFAGARLLKPVSLEFFKMQFPVLASIVKAENISTAYLSRITTMLCTGLHARQTKKYIIEV